MSIANRADKTAPDKAHIQPAPTPDADSLRTGGHREISDTGGESRLPGCRGLKTLGTKRQASFRRDTGEGQNEFASSILSGAVLTADPSSGADIASERRLFCRAGGFQPPAPGLHYPAAILTSLAFCVLAGLMSLLFVHIGAPPAREVELAGYATSLRGRTGSQRINAVKAAKALDGKVIPPGTVFSFNKVVKSWSFDQGYMKAPVSYDGELVRAYGGGVCQTSTTLYNAALLANLPILERHSHVFAPHYVPPGRDAAVAQITVDLRFRNPYAWPIRIRASAKGDSLDIRLLGAERPRHDVQVESEILNEVDPQRLTRVVYRSEGASGRAYVRNPGAVGYRVVTYRVVLQGNHELRRERLADDTYEAMNHIVQVSEAGPP